MGTDAPSGAPEQLGDHIARSARWVTASTLMVSATTWLAVVALSRLLEKREFGLAALAMLAVAVFQLFQDSGLRAALIQRREGIHAAADAAALYAPLAGVALAALCVAGSPLAARFFHQHDVEPLMRGLAGVFVLRSLAIVPGALIQRELLFTRQATISMVSSVLYLASAIGLALAGAGAWAVIGGQLVVAAWVAAASWVASPYRPNPRRASLRELRLLLRYGRHIVAGNVAGFVNSNTDPAGVGRLYGPVSLGAYNIGFQTGRQAVTIVTGIANVLVFPAYARVQGDLDRFRNAYLRSLRFICTISPPIGVGLAAVSGVLVPAVYGSKWNGTGAVGVLVVISFYGIFLSVAATTGEVFKASGRPDLFFKMGVFQIGLLFALIGALYRFGLVGFAGARAGATLVMSIVALVAAGRILALPLVAWLHAIREPFVAALVMGAGVFGLRLGLAAELGSAAWQLVPLVAAGVILYPVALRVLAPERWREFFAEVERILPLRRRAARLRDSSPVGGTTLADDRGDAEVALPTLDREQPLPAAAEAQEVRTR
ncbi:MAG TPA: oligosaccharide flippase family protein [Gaiellaceae bacterium]|nr:oligosaccharide flippase family protein [Gaiellaceae bacterium]